MELDSKIERIVKHVIDDVEHNYKDKHTCMTLEFSKTYLQTRKKML